MATKLHHVNLCSNNVPEMDRFYREVLDLAPIQGRNEWLASLRVEAASQ